MDLLEDCFIDDFLTFLWLIPFSTMLLHYADFDILLIVAIISYILYKYLIIPDLGWHLSKYFAEE